MTNQSALSRMLTIGLMGGILWFVASKRHAALPQAEQTASSPANSNAAIPDSAGDAAESVVWRMLDASRAGDPVRYLDCYTGELELRLRQDFQEMGPARSRTYLVDAHRRLKGIAVQPPRMRSPLEAEIPVEYVYEDRNEVQQIFGKKVSGLWKIERVEDVQRIKTVVPYGTPIQQ